MWPHALAGAAGANLENCRRVFSALTEQLMPVRLGPRAESVLFTDLDDAAQSDRQTNPVICFDRAFVRRLRCKIRRGPKLDGLKPSSLRAALLHQLLHSF